MDAQAIALPRGGSLLWIRVGGLLDPTFARRTDEVVRRIVSIASGFRVETKDQATRTIRCYEAPCFFVCEVVPSFGDSELHLDDTCDAESIEKSPILRAFLTYGV